MSAVLQKSGHGLAGLHKKVYGCVPAIEPQQLHTIACDLRARTGSTASKEAVKACLDDLADEQLVIRIGVDRYRRKSLKDAEVQPIKESKVQEIKPEAPACVVDVLAKIAVEMRDCASHFAARFKAIAERIDDAALLIDQGNSEEAEAVTKLRQLQALLKGL